MKVFSLRAGRPGIRSYSNPLDGFNVFSLETTNDGDARFGTCPCFADEPLVGFDANGYYLSTNAFSLSTMTFRGEQLYAISKVALESAPPSDTPIAVTAGQHFGNLNQAEGPDTRQGARLHPHAR